jgi:hypothetical protein
MIKKNVLTGAEQGLRQLLIVITINVEGMGRMWKENVKM